MAEAAIDVARLVRTFTELARIDSPSGREGAVAAYCASVLGECGCTVATDDAGERIGSDTGNLYAELPATAGESGSVVLTAHMDCVEPCEGVVVRVEGGVICSDGTTVLGSDDKAGVAAILETVRTLAESGAPHVAVKVVLSIQEELGCLGAKNLSAGSFRKGEPCYVLDGEGRPGTLCLAAPYHYTFEARFTGRASHAGVAPEKGVSAIEAASLAVTRMRQRGFLGAVGQWCASNVGRIEGGGATNVVADSCTMTGECRAIDADDVERVRRGMDAAMNDAARQTGATVEVDWNLEYKGFELSEDDPVVERFRRAVEGIGLAFSVEKSAGGTDANMYVKLGVSPAVVSVGMQNFHATDEKIEVCDLANTARIALALTSPEL